MPRLFLKNDKSLLVENLKVAKGFQRLKGLIGKKDLKKDEALFIPKCPSIHTFFMSFPIDVIFMDEDFKIVSMFEELPPNRMVFGGLKSRSTLELKQGQIGNLNLKKGDELYVGS